MQRNEQTKSSPRRSEYDPTEATTDVQDGLSSGLGPTLNAEGSTYNVLISYLEDILQQGGMEITQSECAQDTTGGSIHIHWRRKRCAKPTSERKRGQG